jgi:hypothetical protein
MTDWLAGLHAASLYVQMRTHSDGREQPIEQKTVDTIHVSPSSDIQDEMHDNYYE